MSSQTQTSNLNKDMLLKFKIIKKYIFLDGHLKLLI